MQEEKLHCKIQNDGGKRASTDRLSVLSLIFRLEL